MHGALAPPVPAYRFGAPRYVQPLIAVGGGSALLSLLLIWGHQPLLGGIVMVAATFAAVGGLVVLLAVDRRGRDRVARALCDAIAWRGGEHVLDVGCGNGTVILAAAARLHPGAGAAIGIDVWEKGTRLQNAHALRREAAMAGVADRIHLQRVDARCMPFADATFDVIFASLSLHRLRTGDDRVRAAEEMMRVLKPGGSIVIHDVLPIAAQVGRALRRLGAGDARRLSGSAMCSLRIQKPR